MNILTRIILSGKSLFFYLRLNINYYRGQRYDKGMFSLINSPTTKYIILIIDWDESYFYRVRNLFLALI
jgi:hypothetical protein